MSNVIDPQLAQGAIADLKKMLRSFDGLRAFAETLEAIASIEQAAKEAESRLALAKEEEAKAKGKLADLEARFVADKMKHEQESAAETEKLEAARQRAFDERDAILAAAKRSAEEILQSARSAQSDVTTKTAELRAELERVSSDLAERSAQLAEVKAQLEKIRKQMTGEQ